MAISQLELENFQGYKKASIDFVKQGLNVIVGDNDQGKSSISRAVEYLGKNRPTRNNFINDSKPGQTMKIAIKTEKDTITRIKSKSKNQYVINDEQPLKALKTEVPEEITTTTKLADVNFQAQDNPYFLLSLTPGQVAKEINKVANLEIMDKMATAMKTVLTEAKRETVFWTDKHDKYRAEVDNLKWTEKARESFSKMDLFQKEIDGDIDHYNHIIDVVENIEEREKELEPLKGIDNAIDALETLQEAEEEIEESKDFKITLQEKQTSVKKLLSKLKQYDDIDKAEKALKQLVLLNEQIRDLKDFNIKLLKYQTQAQSYQNAHKEVLDYQKKFKQSLKDAGVCPLCETKF